MKSMMEKAILLLQQKGIKEIEVVEGKEKTNQPDTTIQEALAFYNSKEKKIKIFPQNIRDFLPYYQSEGIDVTEDKLLEIILCHELGHASDLTLESGIEEEMEEQKTLDIRLKALSEQSYEEAFETLKRLKAFNEKSSENYLKREETAWIIGERYVSNPLLDSYNKLREGVLQRTKDILEEIRENNKEFIETQFKKLEDKKTSA